MALFETVDDFVDFSRSYRENFKNLKQTCQDPISPLTARENCSHKFPSVSEIDVIICGHKNGRFQSEKHP